MAWKVSAVPDVRFSYLPACIAHAVSRGKPRLKPQFAVQWAAVQSSLNRTLVPFKVEWTLFLHANCFSNSVSFFFLNFYLLVLFNLWLCFHTESEHELCMWEQSQNVGGEYIKKDIKNNDTETLHKSCTFVLQQWLMETKAGFFMGNSHDLS